MNWKEIKEKYPKAFAELAKWYWSDFRFEILENGTLYFEQVFDGGKSYATTTLSVKDIIKGRRFYDFFDEQGIVIEITLSYTNDINWFEYNIDLLDDRDDWYFSKQESDYKEPYKTRTKAEEQAFLRAFEILETRL